MMAGSIRARVKEFSIPPVRDALVLGKNAPLGCVAVREALTLLVSSPFAHIEFEDDVISDILVRSAVLRRVSKEDLIAFVVEHVKPLMGAEEILHLHLDAEVLVESSTP